MPATLPSSTEAKLSLRQRQILELIRRGKSNNEIAFELGIGVGTVKQHVVALFRKLKVTSRTMAVSRSSAEDSFAAQSPPFKPADVVLERRPCVVLSMTVDGDNTGTLRKLKTALAMYAQETNNIFISWRGQGCDVILGIDQATEIDALQALQGAWKTAGVLAEVAPRDQLRGALAAGLAVASMFRRGGWSGEAIASSAIVLARQRTKNALPGKLFLDASVLDVLRLCGAFVEDGLAAQLPLDAPDALRWHSQERDCRFLGRNSELEALEALFHENNRHPPATVHHLCGDPGSGKSRLCERFTRLSRERARGVRLFRCLPVEAELPFFDARSKRLFGWDALEKQLHACTGDETTIIDDTQWLTREKSKALMAQALQNKGKTLFVRRNKTRADDIVLFPMTKADIEAMAMDMIDSSVTNASNRTRVAREIACLAGGNPLFAVEMARNHPTLASLAAADRQTRQHLPLQIVMLVTASLDRLHLDRRMLSVVASSPKGVGMQDLTHALGEEASSVQHAVAQAVDSGVLRKTGKSRISFAHPMFHNVIHYLGMEP